jgi:hypothetical protein
MQSTKSHQDSNGKKSVPQCQHHRNYKKNLEHVNVIYSVFITTEAWILKVT